MPNPPICECTCRYVNDYCSTCQACCKCNPRHDCLACERDANPGWKIAKAQEIVADMFPGTDVQSRLMQASLAEFARRLIAKLEE